MSAGHCNGELVLIVNDNNNGIDEMEDDGMIDDSDDNVCDCKYKDV